MLIVNKDKQAKSEDKKWSARLLRRAAWSDARFPKVPKRHDQTLCPICTEKLEMAASGGRRKYCCKKCGATQDRRFLCTSCGTNRIWVNKKAVACLGCGAKYQR